VPAPAVFPVRKFNKRANICSSAHVISQPCRQNRPQKVFNRGAKQFCGGAFRLCGRLEIIKLTKTPLIYSVSRFNLGGWSFL